jgi:hypothetical protein
MIFASFLQRITSNATVLQVASQIAFFPVHNLDPTDVNLWQSSPS